MRHRLLLLCALGLAAPAAAQEFPADAPYCGLGSPPEAAAKGFRPTGQPARLFPVNPGPRYTGCQWIWIAYGTPGTWDWWSATYYEEGAPTLQRVRYPPLPVQSTIQKCVYGADGRARKLVEGSDWQRECPAARELQELLRVTPQEGGVWDFL